MLINWAWNYLRKDRPIRMITRVEADPLADELASPDRYSEAQAAAAVSETPRSSITHPA